MEARHPGAPPGSIRKGLEFKMDPVVQRDDERLVTYFFELL
jgi:hypothetical protein